MYPQGIASRGNLQAFFLTSLCILCAHSQVNAGSVNLNFVNVTNYGGAGWTRVNNPVMGGDTEAGIFNWNVNSSTGVSAPFNGSKLQTFCINLGQFLVNGHDYNVVGTIAGLAGLPTPGAAMGTEAAYKLAILANELQGGKQFAGYVNNYDVIQAVVWNVTRGKLTSDITPSGGFYFGGVLTNSTVNSILGTLNTDYLGGYNFATATRFVMALDDTSGSGQDQIVFVNSDDFHHNGGQNPAPVPAGAFLAGMGVFCLGGYNFLRRRKAVVVA